MLTIPETDLVVHPLCLGGNVFGWTADEKQSHDVLNAYASHGGNFIDTADVYSEWKPKIDSHPCALSSPVVPVSSALTLQMP